MGLTPIAMKMTGEMSAKVRVDASGLTSVLHALMYSMAGEK